ncbi:MAG: hypothetical protein KDI08_07265 [Pseudomonadales bacterium]|nr:hypothetical protein [Pseudomonadales bacterium]
MAVNVSVPRTAAEDAGHEKPDPLYRRLAAGAVILLSFTLGVLGIVFNAGWVVAVASVAGMAFGQVFHAAGRQMDAAGLARVIDAAGHAVHGGPAP